MAIPKAYRWSPAWLMRSAVLLAALGITACKDDVGRPLTPVSPVPAGELAAALTGEAASHLRSDGTLNIDGAPAIGVPQIDADQAGRLAHVWALRSGSMVLRQLEQEHGGKVDIPSLHPCGRTLYAGSAFALLPPTEDPTVRRGYGPWWLVNLCGHAGDPEISVAVSALATDLQIQRGRLVFPDVAVTGEYFHWLGIPLGQASLQISPEEAVVGAASVTHRRVAQLPELVITGIDLPGLARWHLSLDSSSTVLVHGGGYRTAKDAFVSRDAAGRSLTTIAQPLQPDSVPVSYFVAPLIGSKKGATRPEPRTLYLHRLPELPVRLDN